MSDEELRYLVAGLLSTIEINPSENHPELMLDMADQVIKLIEGHKRGG